MILLIDNYDSFVYNLVQRSASCSLPPAKARERGIRVFRNDKITPDEAEAAPARSHHRLARPVYAARRRGLQCHYRAFRPAACRCWACASGISALADAFGMTVDRNPRLMHGKTSPVHHDGKTIFQGMTNPFTATRYHSLAIVPETFDHDRFELTAWTQDNDHPLEIMGMRTGPASLTTPPAKPRWKACSSTPKASSPSKAPACWPTSWTCPSLPRLPPPNRRPEYTSRPSNRRHRRQRRRPPTPSCRAVCPFSRRHGPAPG